ncbi:hypothetical protein [Paenibacillus wenxiniae]|uniref:YqzN/YkzM domain-containing protein n=1 Tax=Paenibacillus wenxiniae TaxID=1636843 RepID=A0ABW4RI01_9BACL
MSEPEQAVAYRKEQFLTADRFTRLEKDVLAGLLQSDNMYTMEQAQHLLDQFMNKEAN